MHRILHKEQVIMEKLMDFYMLIVLSQYNQVIKELKVVQTFFIAGFSDYDNWDIELIKEILDGYLYAIYSGSLEIKINDLLLNQETLDQIIHNNRSVIPQKTLAYYDVLTSPKNTLD